MLFQYIIYFIIGGSLVCAITFVGASGRGYWAAFLAYFPLLTLLTIISIYAQAGVEPAVSYAQGLILMTLPLLLYLSFVIWFLPYLGLVVSLLLAVVVYVVAGLAIEWVKRI